MFRYKSGFAPSGICYEPISATTLIVAALGSAAIMGGAQAYSAAKESSAAKKAAEAQKEVGLKQIEASLKGPQLAADAAQAKLRAKQASKTQSILTPPGGMQASDNTNLTSILGV